MAAGSSRTLRSVLEISQHLRAHEDSPHALTGGLTQSSTQVSKHFEFAQRPHGCQVVLHSEDCSHRNCTCKPICPRGSPDVLKPVWADLYGPTHQPHQHFALRPHGCQVVLRFVHDAAEGQGIGVAGSLWDRGHDVKPGGQGREGGR